MSRMNAVGRSDAASQSRAASAAVYLLAEHLDAVLAAGEDLRRQAYDVPKPTGRVSPAAIADRLAAEHAFVAGVRALEVQLISRVLQARVRAAEVVRADIRFRAIVGLFAGGTRPLVDAVADLAPAAKQERQFDWSDDALNFFRSRAVVGPEVASLGSVERLQMSETFRIAGRIELGPLLDLAATFLSALELHYDLFEAADEAATRAASAA